MSTLQLNINHSIDLDDEDAPKRYRCFIWSAPKGRKIKYAYYATVDRNHPDATKKFDLYNGKRILIVDDNGQPYKWAPTSANSCTKQKNLFEKIMSQIERENQGEVAKLSVFHRAIAGDIAACSDLILKTRSILDDNEGIDLPGMENLKQALSNLRAARKEMKDKVSESYRPIVRQRPNPELDDAE